MHHGTCEDIGILLAAKVEAIHLSSISPLVEGLRSLIVLQPLRDGTIYHHLKDRDASESQPNTWQNQQTLSGCTHSNLFLTGLGKKNKIK